MQHFDFTLPVNGAREIHVQGSYVYYLAGSAGGADDTIVLKNVEGSDEVILRPGQSFDIGAGEKFVRWNLSNYKNQGTIVGRLLMGSGTFSDNRISGSVEVIDGGKNRTMAKIAFWGAAYSSTAAGSYPMVQLWNPPGSGKNLVVEQVATAHFGADGAIGLHFSSAPLVNFARNPASKLAGGPVSAAQIRLELNATMPARVFMADIYALMLDLKTIRLSEPIVLVPGSGLLLIGAIAQGITGNFEFYEEDI